MAKIFMGLFEKNKNVKLTSDFKIELKGTKYPNYYITQDDTIQLDIGNDNLVCIFPTRTGGSRVMKNLILQENKKNIVIFDINGDFLDETSVIKLKNGYEIIALNTTQSLIEKEKAILNIKKANKFVIYINIEAKDIEIVAKSPILNFLFKEIRDMKVLTIFDHSSAFLESGIKFLKEMFECENNQIIFRFQAEEHFSLQAFSSKKIDKMKALGLDTNVLLDFYKNINILEIPLGKPEIYNFTNKKNNITTTFNAPTFFELSEYLKRYV